MAKMNIGVESSAWINMILGVLAMGVGYCDTTLWSQSFYVADVAGFVLPVVGAITAFLGASGRAERALWPSALILLAGIFLAAHS
ncbi:MAG: hypothetical protein ACYDDF_15040 [Thermoplasmatota archaeon]